MTRHWQSCKDIENRVGLFFDGVFLPGVLDLRKEFARPFLEELRALRTDLYRIRKDDGDRYEKMLVRLSETAVRSKSLLSDSSAESFGGKWIKALTPLCDELPETVVVRQEDERFLVAENDTLLTALVKRIKSVMFRAGRSISRKGPDEYHWKQVIPLRDLVNSALLHDPAICRDLIAAEYASLARAMAFLLNEIKEDVKSHSSPESAGGDQIATEKKEEEADIRDADSDGLSDDEVKEGSEQKNNGLSKDLEDVSAFRLSVLDNVEEYLNGAIALLIQFHDGEIPFSDALDVSRNRIETRLHKAGTLEFPFRKLSERRKARVSGMTAREIQKIEKQWIIYIRSQITDLEIQLELARFGSEAMEAEENLLKATHGYFRDHFYLPMEEGVRFLREMIAGITELKSPRITVREIEKAREAFRIGFSEKTTAFMGDTDLQEQFLARIGEILSELELQMNGFSENLLVAEKRKLAVPWPEVKIDDFAWRAIASRFLKDKAINELQPDRQKFPELLREQLNTLEETVNIIDVNLEAALASEQGESGESSFTVAASGMERAISTIEKGIRNVREKQDAYEQQIRTRLPDAFQNLAGLMLSRSYDQFERRDKALQMKTTALSWKEKAIRGSAIFMEQSELAYRYSKIKVREYRKPVAKFLGWKEEDTASLRHKQDLTEYLTRSASLLNTLPYIYQRLFRRSFLIDRRFYIDDQNNVNRLMNGYQQWEKGLAWNMAIVGQKGSGKSTLLHFFLEQLGDRHEVVAIGIDATISSPEKLMRIISGKLGYPETEDLEELINKIRADSKKRVLVFEGLQNVYIRNINGYEAIRSFWVLMSQTTTQLFWVATCSSSAWEFFDRMFGVRQLFSQTVRTDQLTAMQIEKGIMVRHKATGYGLEFEASEKIRKTRAYRKLLGRDDEIQQLLRKEYFEQLAEISAGNFSSAMIFWLQSIREFDDARFVIGLSEVADIDILDITSRDVLFALAALIRHDTLTAGDLALAMHINVSDSKLILGQLSSRGLIVSTKNGFLINHLVYRQIKELLHRKNILH